MPLGTVSWTARLGFSVVGVFLFAFARIISLATNQVNKHFHIFAGWFAYFAGLVQCYRGLELVSGTDKLVFSAVEINFTVSVCLRVGDAVFFPVLGIKTISKHLWCLQQG